MCLARSQRASSSEEGGRTLHLEGDDDVDLTDFQRLLIIAMGKGATAMLTCFLETLRPLQELLVEGILVAPEAPEVLSKDIRFFAGGPPFPNQATLLESIDHPVVILSAGSDGIDGTVRLRERWLIPECFSILRSALRQGGLFLLSMPIRC